MLPQLVYCCALSILQREVRPAGARECYVSLALPTLTSITARSIMGLADSSRTRKIFCCQQYGSVEAFDVKHYVVYIAYAFGLYSAIQIQSRTKRAQFWAFVYAPFSLYVCTFPLHYVFHPQAIERSGTRAAQTTSKGKLSPPSRPTVALTDELKAKWRTSTNKIDLHTFAGFGSVVWRPGLTDSSIFLASSDRYLLGGKRGDGAAWCASLYDWCCSVFLADFKYHADTHYTARGDPVREEQARLLERWT